MYGGILVGRIHFSSRVVTPSAVTGMFRPAHIAAALDIRVPSYSQRRGNLHLESHACD